MKQFLSLLAFAFCLLNLHAQNVGIGTTTPNASAALDITSTNKGVLIPRMTTAQRDAIASPALGLMIMNLDDKCADIWNGTTWIKNCGFAIDTASQLIWTQKADFGEVIRSDAVGFSIGAKGYMGTGFNTGEYKDFWEYDPSSNSWTQKADIGIYQRSSAVGFSIGSKGYIGTGTAFWISTNRTKDFWEYDPSSNTWTQKADFGGTSRTGAVGFSIGTKGYIGTGLSYTYEKDFWEYDPSSNTWTQKADFGGFGSQRTEAVGFSIGTKGYIGTGYYSNYSLSDFWEYNPATNSWIQKAPFTGTARKEAVGFSIGTKGYIGTGYDGSYRKDFWEYNPDTNSWIKKVDFGGTARNRATGFSIGTKGYLGTGYNGSFMKDFWDFNPDISANLIYPVNNPMLSPVFQNGWINYGLGFADAKYYKDKEGVVHIRGLIKSGTFTPNTVLFTLPVGYRPSTSGGLIFTVDNAASIGRVDVQANGNVVVVTATTNAFLNLTGISFRAD
jgi:hypothetical protein